MARAVLLDCLPWLALLLLSGAAVWLIVRVNEGGLHLRRLLTLHRNEVGSAQSLSFVLTLPIFVVIVMFIVQVSQLMIGSIMVHYAAFAAARAAVVWVPAGIGSRTNWTVAENCVEGYTLDRDAPDQAAPSLTQPTEGGLTYLLAPAGVKYDKIRSAAWLACLPICPSRNLGLELLPQGTMAEPILKDMYQVLARTSPHARLRHKLAYAMRYTLVDVRFYHGNTGDLEPALVPWGIRCDGRRASSLADDPGASEYRMWQEIGWQDPITVTVTHYLALLPGPGRFLANRVQFCRTPSSEVQEQIEQDTAEAQPPRDVYVYKLSASCTLGNEGEKSELPYEYQLY